MKLVEVKHIRGALSKVHDWVRNNIGLDDDINIQIDQMETICKCRFVGEYRTVKKFNVEYAIFEKEEDFTWFILNWS